MLILMHRRTLGVSSVHPTIRLSSKIRWTPWRTFRILRRWTRTGFRERLKMLKAIEADFIAKRTGHSTEAHEAIYKKADQLINSPKIDAFHLNEEPTAIPGKLMV